MIDKVVKLNGKVRKYVRTIKYLLIAIENDSNKLIPVFYQIFVNLIWQFFPYGIEHFNIVQAVGLKLPLIQSEIHKLMCIF